jgi:hypothetical protein
MGHVLAVERSFTMSEWGSVRSVAATCKKRGRNASTLAEEAPFAFDDDVTFSEEGHIYYVCGKKAEMSVTSLVKSAFPASANFDGRAICQTNLARWRSNGSARYHTVVADISDDEDAISAVLALWERNKNLGTLTHKAVELTLNDEIVTHDVMAADVQRELDQFLMWHDRQSLAGWRAVRTELSLYHTRANEETVAGQIDVLYTDNTGKYRVVDVKRSDKQLHADAPNFEKWGAGHAAALKDIDFFKYSLQTAIYSVMFSRLTGKEMGVPLLVQVHPDLSCPNVIPCADLKNVAEQLLDGDEPVSGH